MPEANYKDRKVLFRLSTAYGVLSDGLNRIQPEQLDAEQLSSEAGEVIDYAKELL